LIAGWIDWKDWKDKAVDVVDTCGRGKLEAVSKEIS
jgi:hypothetical protein